MAGQKITQKPIADALKDDAYVLVTQKEAVDGEQVESLRRVKAKTFGEKFGGAVSVDKTLTKADWAADAKATGDAVQKNAADISELKGDLADIVKTDYSTNLCNPNMKYEDGYYIIQTGELASNANFKTSEYVKFDNTKPLCFSMKVKHPAWNNSIHVCQYDADMKKVYFEVIILDNMVHNITVNNNAKYIRWDINKTDFATDPQIFIGYQSASSFSYEEYYETKKLLLPSQKDAEQDNRLTALEDICSNTNNTVVYWGDSLTQGGQDGIYGNREVTLRNLLDSSWVVKNYGVGGETSNAISTRASGSWVYLQPVTIPSDTSTVEIILKDEYGNDVLFGNAAYSSAYPSWVTINPCYVNGVECTISRVNGSSPLTIKRNSNGESLVINRPTRVIFNSKTFSKKPVLIICMGQNEGFSRDANILLQQIKGIIEQSNSDRYIVVGIPHSLYGYTWQAPINEALKKEFGKHYLDIEKYLKTPIYNGETIVSSYALSDAGLTPTSNDLMAIERNQYPPQIMFDNVHFNHYGYEVWGNAEYKLGKELGYWD